MEDFTEFQGRDLDECIRDACAYFDAPREKLEVEIIQDAKSGIFGIVMARKAMIRARRAHIEDAVQDLLGNPGATQRQKGREQKDQKGKQASRAAHDHDTTAPATPQTDRDAACQAASRSQAQKSQTRKKVLPARPEPDTHLDACQEDADALEGFSACRLEDLDAERLGAVASQIVGMLVRPIAGHAVPVTIEIGPGSVRAKIAWEGDAGLLIGREGQTLAAVQYLASRMVSRAMNCALRIQLDIGDYRTRQDERLRELARNLAEKARQTGRSYSTRPLSSYHRRIIHLCLQDSPDIMTRSSGEGTLKRVLISPRRQAER